MPKEHLAFESAIYPDMGGHDISSIIEHYENCLEQFGDSPKGMDWPNGEDLTRRFEVMASVVRKPDRPIEILDLGCGSGQFMDFLRKSERMPPWRYQGIDISPAMIEVAQKTRGDAYFTQRDILSEPLADGASDYVVMNGLLTEKRELSQTQMIAYAQDIIAAAFRTARLGIAFNVMSKNVDWERDDLFHWGLDDLTDFLCERVSRHIVIRNDYGLYEYTAYVYKEPLR